MEEQKKQSLKEWVEYILVVLLIVLPLRAFIIQPFIVSGSSMFPTFEDGNYLIVDEISYKLENPNRYDVVIFKYPDPNPENKTKYYIKRIIGLPGETIIIDGSSVFIKNKENPDGFEIDQPYVKNQAKNNLQIELKDSEYFVMGDNRSASSDSRSWGPLPKENLVGRALLRLLPINKVALFPGEYVEVD
ncbi:signal peptidase I [Candidatus Nomurabacteria bacterium]|nr:signal peptidase I [Candidatus Nomurabacteria bacterium]